MPRTRTGALAPPPPPPPPAPLAGFAGYAVYPTQGAVSGVVPVKQLSKLSFSNCIGMFANYNSKGPYPKLNDTLIAAGYAVGGGWGGAGAAGRGGGMGL